MITFRDLKQGYQIYTLDKEKMKAERAKVVNVGIPYAEPPKVGQLAPSLNKLVDVTIEADGKSQTYAIPETATITYAGDVVLSVEPEPILREVQAMRAQSESILLSVDAHREKIERCDEILETLDTAFREKKEIEGRLSKVEAFMCEMKDDLKNLIKQLNG
jgi:hypothetical protein